MRCTGFSQPVAKVRVIVRKYGNWWGGDKLVMVLDGVFLKSPLTLCKYTSVNHPWITQGTKQDGLDPSTDCCMGLFAWRLHVLHLFVWVSYYSIRHWSYCVQYYTYFSASRGRFKEAGCQHCHLKPNTNAGFRKDGGPEGQPVAHNSLTQVVVLLFFISLGNLM